MSVTLLEFPKPADITEQLRALANDIDSGAYGDVEAIAFALHGSDGLWAISYGRTDPFYVRGLLATAADVAIGTLMDGE